MNIYTTITIIIILIFAFSTLNVAISQSKYIYRPDRTVSATPADIGLAFEALTLKTEDHENISAWFIPKTTDGKTAKKTILFCHGNAGDIGDRLESLKTFNKLGFNTLIFDYRGFGESSGTPSEKGTYLDALACRDYLIDKRHLRSEDIIIFGRSLGAAIACRTAADAKPHALILESGFASVPAMARKMFPLLPVGIFCRYKYDNLSTITKVRCPVIIAHSKTDRTCPYTQGQQIFKAARQPKKFIEFKGDHNEGGLDTNPHYQTKLIKFLNNITPTP